MNRILIVEDEITISRLIAVSLRRAGYDCTVANDGSTAADLIAEHDFDLALLDIMLPGLDGYELLGYLRPLGVPVIFITAKGATKDRVRGLQLGADDYIVKPFEIEELLARVEAVLRRTGRGGQTLTAFDVTMDIVARTVTRQGKAVVLVLPDLPLALSPADRLAVLKGGRLLAVDGPEALCADGILNSVFGIELGRVMTDRGWRYYYL